MKFPEMQGAHNNNVEPSGGSNVTVFTVADIRGGTPHGSTMIANGSTTNNNISKKQRSNFPPPHPALKNFNQVC
jgi:hypothetical protein